MNNIEQHYQASLDYLYSFVDYSLTRQLRYSPDKFNLERMNKLMELMGNPQTCYPVVHIAGTKGKGSTSAMIASILQECGYKVGLYTSPHLQDYVERIQIDGVPITHADLVRYVDILRELAPKVEGITTFELTTAIGFQAFKDAGINAAVVEVGLGGRLDATNIVTPNVSVITSLSMDHMNFLGDTLEKIAFEKGGIIKSGIPVVLAPQKEEAKKVIQTLCKERDSELIDVGTQYATKIRSFSLDGQEFEISKTDGDKEKHNFSIPLAGAHQVTNAATAFAVLDVLKTSGFSVTEKGLSLGFSKVKWPARFEVISRDPIIVLDCAHNPDSAEKLCKTINEYLPGKGVLLVFGASEDKDIEGMFQHLLPISTSVIMTRSEHPRAAETKLLVELARKIGKQAVAIEPIEEALQSALPISGDDQVILITGSIFIAAAAREILLKLGKVKQE
jgi:dihydrofolate synthase/folylpolyglutamate synthase